MVAVSLHFSTGVRVYTVLPLPGQLQVMNHMLFMLFYSILFGNSILSTQILIQNSSNEGRGSHFALSLD